MADEIIRLDYSAEDIGANIDEVRTARGTFDTLDDRLDNIEGGGPSPSNPIASNCVSPMTGYSKSSSSAPGDISTSDTLNAAIGKLEKRTELNENNILLLEQANGAKNLFDFANINYTAARCTVSKNSNDLTITNTGDYAYCYFISSMQAGQYVFSCRITDRSGGSTTRISLRKGSTSGAELGGQTFTANGDISIAFTLSADDNVYILYYAADGTQVNTTTYKASNNMIITKEAYDAGFTDYQPYALSNAELTADVASLTAKSQKTISSSGNTSKLRLTLNTSAMSNANRGSLLLSIPFQTSSYDNALLLIAIGNDSFLGVQRLDNSNNSMVTSWALSANNTILDITLRAQPWSAPVAFPMAQVVPPITYSWES